VVAGTWIIGGITMTRFLSVSPLKHPLKIIFAIFFVTAPVACVTGTTTSNEEKNSGDSNVNEPFELVNQDHQLVGKIWDVKNQQFINRQQLLDKALQSNYVMLGETHDNIRHHQDHGWFIEKISNQKPKTAVAMEMVNKEQADGVNKETDKNLDKVINILEQAKVGWEYDKYYRPVFSSIINAGLTVYPADLERATMMQVVRGDGEGTPEELQALLDKTPLPEDQQEALKTEIEKTHCGMINAEMTTAMMRGQRTRDAAIANNLYKIRQSDEATTVILVSGSGHIRKDRGAPMYLGSQDKNAAIITIAWLEVDENTTDPAEYLHRWGDDALPFDYVVFTPSADRPDPCEEMRKFMEKHKKKHGDNKDSEKDDK
jgi:uncharacterized iron-regulated protein